MVHAQVLQIFTQNHIFYQGSFCPHSFTVSLQKYLSLADFILEPLNVAPTFSPGKQVMSHFVTPSSFDQNVKSGLACFSSCVQVKVCCLNEQPIKQNRNGQDYSLAELFNCSEKVSVALEAFEKKQELKFLKEKLQ